jgi:hypothetical protein
MTNQEIRSEEHKLNQFLRIEKQKQRRKNEEQKVE